MQMTGIGPWMCSPGRSPIRSKTETIIEGSHPYKTSGRSSKPPDLALRKRPNKIKLAYPELLIRK